MSQWHEAECKNMATETNEGHNGEKRLINFMCLPVCRHQVDVSIHRLPGKEEHLQRERERESVCVCVCLSGTSCCYYF